MEEKVFIESEDGLKICGIWTTPDRKSENAIVLAHGITVDKDEEGKFSETAKLLAQEGYAVFRFDFRGHGESDGTSQEMTISGELLDMKAAFQEVRSKGYSKIGLVGASFGGGASAIFAANNPQEVTCLCLWNPVLNYDHCFIDPYLPWLIEKKEKMLDTINAEGYAEIGSRKYRIGKNLWEEMKQTYPYEKLKSVSVPVMIIHGDKDTYVPYDDSKEYFENIPGPKEFVTVKDGQHGLNNVPEEKKQADENTIRFLKTYL